MKKMNFHPGNVARTLIFIGGAAAVAATLQAQAASQPGPHAATSTTIGTPAPHAKTARHHTKKPTPVVTPVPLQPPAPQVLQSLFDKPSQPATVRLTGNSLVIHANNSSLRDILQQVTGTSGMQVEGLAQDQRIFGTYGPGDPHAVLDALLDGSGYNVIMLGQTSDGTPRQLTLSPRNNMPSMPHPVNVVPVNHDDDPVEEDTQQPVDDQPPTPPQPAPNAQRTPQQMMQQQQQQSQPDQQQPPDAQPQ